MQISDAKAIYIGSQFVKRVYLNGVKLKEFAEFEITIELDVANLNLRTLFESVADFYQIDSAMDITFIVAEGVTISGEIAGTASLTTGLWPESPSITLINNGAIRGMGGDGGNAGVNYWTVESTGQGGRGGGGAGANAGVRGDGMCSTGADGELNAGGAGGSACQAPGPSGYTRDGQPGQDGSPGLEVLASLHLQDNGVLVGGAGGGGGGGAAYLVDSGDGGDGGDGGDVDDATGATDGSPGDAGSAYDNKQNLGGAGGSAGAAITGSELLL